MLFVCDISIFPLTTYTKGKSLQRIVLMKYFTLQFIFQLEDLMLPVRMDVREHSSVIQVLEDLQERLSHGGCIAAIVCNAGICSSLPFELTDMEDIRNMMNVNVLGVCDIIQTVNLPAFLYFAFLNYCICY
jgi:NAD(P)-dependent dehydrogenase (short-subunit alcohol dehydrogenase family)